MEELLEELPSLLQEASINKSLNELVAMDRQELIDILQKVAILPAAKILHIVDICRSTIPKYL